MGLPVYEQETNINFMRDEDAATVYTSDSTTMTKLDKLIALPDAEWKLKEIHRLESTGEIVGKTYICPKKLVSLRKGNKKPTSPVGFQRSQIHK